MILDNSKREWKHHSCGIFPNPMKRTPFEFKEEDGVFPADILRSIPVLQALIKWLGENHINIRLSGQNKERMDMQFTNSARSLLAEARNFLLRTDFFSL